MSKSIFSFTIIFFASSTIFVSFVNPLTIVITAPLQPQISASNPTFSLRIVASVLSFLGWWFLRNPQVSSLLVSYLLCKTKYKCLKILILMNNIKYSNTSMVCCIFYYFNLYHNVTFKHLTIIILISLPTFTKNIDWLNWSVDTKLKVFLIFDSSKLNGMKLTGYLVLLTYWYGLDSHKSQDYGVMMTTSSQIFAFLFNSLLLRYVFFYA